MENLAFLRENCLDSVHLLLISMVDPNTPSEELNERPAFELRAFCL